MSIGFYFDCAVLCSDLHFFGKIEQSKTALDAKLNCKTHFIHDIFRFFELLVLKFAKCAKNDPTFFAEMPFGYQKTPDFMLISSPLKKLQKGHPKKLLHILIRVEKSLIFSSHVS
jgi:hypothetical protein